MDDESHSAAHADRHGIATGSPGDGGGITRGSHSIPIPIPNPEEAYQEENSSLSLEEPLRLGGEVLQSAAGEYFSTDVVATMVPRSTEPPPVDRGEWLDPLPPSAKRLKPHQLAQIIQVRDALFRHRRVLVQLSTGGGKTHEIAMLVEAAYLAGLRVLVLATRTRLVRQIHERLDDFSIPHGVIAAPLPSLRNGTARIQIASVLTLHTRAKRNEVMPLPPADIVIYDEAHLSTSDTSSGVVESYPDAVQFGFTATPASQSGRALRKWFDHLILGPPMADLIARGVLVRPRIFNKPVVTANELKSLNKVADDYANGALGELMKQPKLLGDVVQNWLRIANGKRTLVFAVNKSHGQFLTQEFRKSGVAAELLTDKDDEPTREAAIARLESGETRVLVNCFLLSYGVDVPTVECVVIARPTRSLVLYLQIIGRGMRSADGKDHVIVIDHGRVVETLGMPTADFGWTLDESVNVNRRARESSFGSKTIGTEKPRTCPECGTFWLVSEDGSSCFGCGWAPAPPAKHVSVEHADLVEAEWKAGTGATANSTEVVQFYREALGYYKREFPGRWAETPEKGKFFALQKTRDKFDIAYLPDSVRGTTPLPPSVKTNGWLQYQKLKWIKSQHRSRA